MHPACLPRHAAPRLARVLAGAAGGSALVVTLGMAGPTSAAVHAVRTATVTNLVGVPLGVSVLSDNNAWVVSDGGTFATDAILHWNGTQWTKMTYPGRATGVELQGVTVLSASDVWAVGFFPGRNGYKAVTEHWDGTSWTRVAVPSPAFPNGFRLSGVSGDSSSDVWAASGNVILHWDGTSWTQVAVPGINALDVAALLPSDVWLVGQGAAARQGAVTRALHWDGTSWMRVPTPTPPSNGGSANAKLVSVSALTPDDIWAVGTYTTTTQVTRSLALHWNGTKWTRVPLPEPGTSTIMNGMDAVSPTLAWAVGTYVTTSGGTFTSHNLLLEWNGTAWKQIAVPQLGGVLDSVSASSASNAWAVGDYQAADHTSRTVMLHWDGTSWTRS